MRIGKIIWAIATYNLLMVIYAANNIPYCALSGVMTGDSRARTSLASWRFVCAMAAAFVVNVFTVDWSKFFGRGDSALGYQLTMALWGGARRCLLCGHVRFYQGANQPKSRGSDRRCCRIYRTLSRNGPWIALFSIAVLIYIQLALRSGTMLYYFNYYLQADDVFAWIDNFGVFNGVGLACTIVGVVLSEPTSRAIWETSHLPRLLVCVFSDYGGDWRSCRLNSFATLLSLQILLQLAFGPTIPILWANDGRRRRLCGVEDGPPVYRAGVRVDHFRAEAWICNWRSG